MRIAIMIVVFILIACHATPPPVPPQPPSNASCETWCAHAADLHCAAAEKTPAGADCVDVCKNFDDGPLALNVECRTVALSCATADECENGGFSTARLPATCAGWCAHATSLKCTAARVTTAGASCEAVCANANSGAIKWNLQCRVTAKTCAAADHCEAP